MNIRACTPDDLASLIPLLDDAFVFGKGRLLSLSARFSIVFCHNNLHNFLLLTHGKKITAALAMRPFDWREGNELFRGVMIGMVYTHPARRGKGMASRLLEASVARLREEKIDFGVLWTGRPAFYARLGWIAADASVLGEIEIVPSEPEYSARALIFSPEEKTPQLENIRQRFLNTMTLRGPNDYRQFPLPVERVDLLWCENQDGMAYALLGSHGKTGFLYEMIGHPNNFPALWQEICHNRHKIFINDRIDSASHHWFANDARINWKNNNLAMWLPLSERASMPRLSQWVIPYFDRI